MTAQASPISEIEMQELIKKTVPDAKVAMLTPNHDWKGLSEQYRTDNPKSAALFVVVKDKKLDMGKDEELRYLAVAITPPPETENSKPWIKETSIAIMTALQTRCYPPRSTEGKRLGFGILEAGHPHILSTYTEGFTPSIITISTPCSLPPSP
jgi:hypothetical protein